MLLGNGDKGPELGVVGAGRKETVVDLQEFPVGLGLGKGLSHEVDLSLLGLVARGGIFVLVDGGALLVLLNEAVRVDDDKGCGPVLADNVVGVVRQSLGTKVPAVVVQGCQLGFEINTGLAIDDIVVTKALVPGGILIDTLRIHVDPSLLEAVDTSGGEANTAVVEVVSNGDEG